MPGGRFERAPGVERRIRSACGPGANAVARSRRGSLHIAMGQDAGRVFKAVDEGTPVYREIIGACM